MTTERSPTKRRETTNAFASIDSNIKASRVSASGSSFRIFPRRQRATPSKANATARGGDHNVAKKQAVKQASITNNDLLNLKIRILHKNPALLQQLRQVLQEAPSYTNASAAPHVAEFLGRIRMPELRQELQEMFDHQPQTSGGRWLGYLSSSATASNTSPTAAVKMRPVVTKIGLGPTVIVEKSASSEDLQIPCLSTTECSDGEESDESIVSIRLEF